MLAIVLGSGMSRLLEFVDIENTIPYNDFLPFSTLKLEGHEHILYEAKINNISAIILSGKLHLYEGYTYTESVAPLKYVSDNYKITQWLITSASGGLNSKSKIGDWQKISDIITIDYLKSSIHLNNNKNTEQSYGLTYAYQKGPSLGTIAEYKNLALLGADLVGMSMLPESIFLKNSNQKKTLYSLPVCNYHPIDYRSLEPSHTEVMEIADQSIKKLHSIISNTIKNLD